MATIKHTKESLKLAHFAQGLTGWHTYKPTAKTLRAVDRCVMLGVIQDSRETRQFRPRSVAVAELTERNKTNPALNVLRHHCSKGEPIVGIPANPPDLLTASKNALSSLDWVLSVMPDIPAGSEFRLSVGELRAAISQAEGGKS